MKVRKKLRLAVRKWTREGELLSIQDEDEDVFLTLQKHVKIKASVRFKNDLL